MKKIAIIGASYLQNPLILKAKELGLETHVFAWECGDIGEQTADFFYPISIVEKEQILEKCKAIEIDGICTIASDLAAITVNYVATKLGLTGNSIEATEKSTNKHMMRNAFEEHGDPSPKSVLVSDVSDLEGIALTYPVIVKPLDRSGSRGITKVFDSTGLEEAIKVAEEQGFEKHALVEEYVGGQEYSIECISYKGEHHFLAMTKKYTSGTPHFIETGHMEPAPVSKEIMSQIKEIVFHALDSLGLKYGASHTELKIAKDGTVRIIEIGGRMGGDFIGSNLVRISSGVDFVRAVIQVAMGDEPDLSPVCDKKYAGIRFIFTEEDVEVIRRIKKTNPEIIVASEIHDITGEVQDSSTRFGYCLMQTNTREELEKYLPRNEG